MLVSFTYSEQTDRIHRHVPLALIIYQKMLLCKIFRKIPYTRVAEVDLPEKKFLVFLDCMSQHAFEDSCTLANPCTPNAAESR